MLKEDSEVSTVDNDGAYRENDLKATLSPDRLADYLGLISKLELGFVSKVAGTSRIDFALWNKPDFLMGGTNEYFVYAETTPGDAQYIVDSLDRLRVQTDAFAFKKIADQWYLHVDNW